MAKIELTEEQEEQAARAYLRRLRKYFIDGSLVPRPTKEKEASEDIKAVNRILNTYL